METRPNILLITTDQQRWDALGCVGGWIETPALDRLATGAVRFENAVTTSPVCMPARFSLATGRYPHELGMWNNSGERLTAESRTWMQAVRRSGYRSGCFGKTHFYPNAGDLYAQEPVLKALGFDTVDEIAGPRGLRGAKCRLTTRWEEHGVWAAFREDYAERFATREYLVRPSPLPLEDYYDVYVAEQARSWLSEREGETPWFCWLSFAGPHEPFDTPEPYAGSVDPSDMPPPRSMPTSERHDRAHGQLDKLPTEEHYHGNVDLDRETVAELRADYAASVRLIDDQIGEVIAQLQVSGQWDNTVVIVSSDHGELVGDGGLIYKCCFLDGAVRVPLLVSTPETRRSGGAVTSTPTEWHDIGSTCVDLAGATLDFDSSARSLVPVLHDPTHRHRDAAFSEIDHEVMLLNEDWKMAVNANGEPYLLIDRRNDPAESRNLAAETSYQDVETELLTRIQQHRQG